jgi:hypothetical protein
MNGCTCTRCRGENPGLFGFIRAWICGHCGEPNFGAETHCRYCGEYR